jgi:hypothetical protein
MRLGFADETHAGAMRRKLMQLSGCRQDENQADAENGSRLMGEAGNC